MTVITKLGLSALDYVDLSSWPVAKVIDKVTTFMPSFFILIIICILF